MKRNIARIALALTAALALAGCGSSGTTQDSSSDHNSADVEFLAGMVPHHQQAVQMAAMAQDRASSPEVKTLAAKIEAAQGPEIEQMEGWLKEWGEETGEPGDSGDDMGGMDHGSDDSGSDDSGSGHDMGGMMDEDDMSSLKGGSGTNFDRMFLQMMIRHHEGAVEAAKSVQENGKSAEVKALAEKIEADQTAEITQMKQLLGS